MKKILLMSFVVLAVSYFASAEMLLKYDFTSSMNPGFQAPNINGGSFGYFGNGSVISTSDSYWIYGGWDDAEYTDNFYFMANIMPNWQLNISSITWDSDVSDLYGPESARVTATTMAGTSIIEDDIFIGYSGTEDYSANANPLTGLTGIVTIRIYAKDAGETGGSFDIDNVTLNGTLTQVPEPASLCLLALGAFCLTRKK